MQPSLDFDVRFSREAYSYGVRADGGTHGTVLTKPHVVELILDIAGYSNRLDLSKRHLLEPSCGHGVFVVAAVERLMVSARRYGKELSELEDAITAFDIEEGHVELTRAAVVAALQRHGVSAFLSQKMAIEWVRAGDFLLTPVERCFDFVVGNPPSIRIEQLAPELQAEYRRRYSTIF